jgi:hypothetical protein
LTTAIQASAPPAAAAASAGERLHALDSLRATAMLLGIVLHAGVSLAPIPVPWPVRDVSRGEGFVAMLAFIHGFRMQVFFLLAGFFGHLLWRRLGTRGFLKQRAQRIGVPFVAGLLILIPIIRLLWIWADMRTGSTFTLMRPLALEAGQVLGREFHVLRLDLQALLGVLLGADGVGDGARVAARGFHCDGRRAGRRVQRNADQRRPGAGRADHEQRDVTGSSDRAIGCFTQGNAGYATGDGEGAREGVRTGRRQCRFRLSGGGGSNDGGQRGKEEAAIEWHGGESIRSARRTVAQLSVKTLGRPGWTAASPSTARRTAHDSHLRPSMAPRHGWAGHGGGINHSIARPQ